MALLRVGRQRLVVVGTLALGALMASSGVALADTISGQHGNYVFKDTQAAAGVKCVYSGSGPYTLRGLIVPGPHVWWPDTDTNSDTQHGTVGWRAIVQVSTAGAYGPWTKLSQTAVQKKTAYEDHPAYDPADKAALTKKSISVNAALYAGQPNTHVRILVKASWYAPGGGTLGTVTHEQTYYIWKNVPGNPTYTTACPLKTSSM